MVLENCSFAAKKEKGLILSDLTQDLLLFEHSDLKHLYIKGMWLICDA